MRFVGQHTRRESVDLRSEFRLGFGFVDGGVGGGVDDDVRSYALNRGGETGLVGEVAAQLGAIVIKRDHFSQRREAALQFPADLTVLAE